MKRTLCLLALGLAGWCGAANAANIAIFNTGVDATGNPLPDGTVGDPNYSLVTVPGGTTTTLVRQSAGGFPIPPYLGDDSLSAWIGPFNDTILDGPAGVYDYQTSFDLTGLDPTTATLTGQWAVDNEGLDILINGVSTGSTAGGFSSWSSFTVASGFVAGVNTLDFIVNNDSGPTALRVEVSGTADAETSGAPEPAATTLMGAGFVVLGLLRRRAVLGCWNSARWFGASR